jgi:hypothetical protein
MNNLKNYFISLTPKLLDLDVITNSKKCENLDSPLRKDIKLKKQSFEFFPPLK